MNVRCSMRRGMVAAGVVALGVAGSFAPYAAAAAGTSNHATVTSRTPLPVRNGTAVDMGTTPRSRRSVWQSA